MYNERLIWFEKYGEELLPPSDDGSSDSEESVYDVKGEGWQVISQIYLPLEPKKEKRERKEELGTELSNIRPTGGDGSKKRATVTAPSPSISPASNLRFSTQIILTREECRL